MDMIRVALKVKGRYVASYHAFLDVPEVFDFGYGR